jgi:hypothetical protein
MYALSPATIREITMRTLRAVAALAALALPGVALAGPVDIANSTYDVAYSSGSGGGPAGYDVAGSAGIGTGFGTSGLVETGTVLAGGGYSIDLTYTTQFSGTESVGGQPVSYADVFLRSGNAGFSSSPFGLAISLGDQAANGGLAAGLYSVSSAATSQQLWGQRSGYVYGGQYSAGAGQAGYDADTVLTGGTKLSGASYTSTLLADGDFSVDIRTVLHGAQATAFEDLGFDAFWGTADCANGAFMASVAAVPEPATIAVLGAGLLGLCFMRRSRSSGAAVS